MALGDGDISRISRTECLRIVLGTDKPKLIKYASQIIEKVINKKPSVIERNTSNCVNITIYQNNLAKRLEIPIGARKNMIIKFPNWLRNKKVFLIYTLKGLFEAEASFSVHKKSYTYNLSFSNMNVSLLNQVQKVLIRFGYHPERRINAVRLRRKSEVYKFIKLISFREYPLI